ncbi:MAG TPA: hypothetical protein ENI08_01930, partial [Candidatus Dependentiae bacterium]|nr:hypothetical protein [Candidatus Dependentiae bacterium]
MAQLIQMRQRIKAIETIKKMTHAMRLISMSTHARLKNMQVPLQDYMEATTTIFNKIKSRTPQWQHPVIYPIKTQESKPLIILIGSQKGLCGNFNYALFKFFEKKVPQPQRDEAHTIIIGKKAVDYSKEKKIGTIVKTYNECKLSMLLPIAQEITNHIMRNDPPYTSVTIFSNLFKTFFIQLPQRFTLIPFQQEENKIGKAVETGEDYVWEQEPSIVLDTLAHL